MKRYLYMTFAVLGFLGSTIPYAEAGNLTGVRVSNPRRYKSNRIRCV